MKYIYKQVKCYRPHCPVCGEQLGGNGSIEFPYHCKCGVWKYNFSTNEFDIIKKDGESLKT